MRTFKMLKAHVALQRLDSKKRKFMGRNKFLAWAKKQSDAKKTNMRRILTCLQINGFVDKDYQLSYAILTTKELKEKKCRSRARAIAMKKCGLKFRKGQVLHHKNHNSCDNSCKNFQILGNLQHRKMHRKKYMDEICQNYLFKVASKLLS